MVSTKLKFKFSLLLSLIAAATAQAVYAADKLCSSDDEVDVVEEHVGDTYRLMLKPPQTLEATINIDLTLKNMTAVPGTHFKYYVDGFHHSYNQPVEVARFSAGTDGGAYNYDWNYQWEAGVPGAKPDYKYVYALPFRRGEHYRINQGYFGTYSHQRGTASEYALDFDLPENTPVCAAREGVVILSLGTNTLGGGDKKYENCGNLVMVKHSDGTYASYFHLRPGGNIAKIGQRVRKGDVIGMSGHTGFADQPHLHFIVSVTIDGKTNKSIPTAFQTDRGIVPQLKEGETY